MTELTTFLRDFHARFPGCTSRAFADGDTGRGESTYQWLVSAALALQPRAVLDLACGDGYLLQLLAQARPDGPVLCGVDLSPHELSLAAQRLQGSCKLFEAPADQLPLAASSVEVVICHMALMLMDPVAPVLSEVWRVLRPGGRLLAVVSGDRVRGDAYECFLNALQVVPDLARRGPRFGDPTVKTEAGWSEVLTAAGFAQVAIEACPVRFAHTPKGAWAWLSEMYTLALLTEPERQSLCRTFLQAVQPLTGPDGLVSLTAGLRTIVAQR